jgi:hypothetical protein
VTVKRLDRIIFSPYFHSMTVGELIDALGGRMTISTELGILPSAVSNWRKFGVIPPQHGIRLQQFCRKRGVPFDETLFKPMTGAERREAAQ